MAPRIGIRRRARAARWAFDTNSFLAALGPRLPEALIAGIVAGLLLGLGACDGAGHGAGHGATGARGDSVNGMTGETRPLGGTQPARGSDGAPSASRAAELARPWLEMAWTAAEAVPRTPHAKTRARLQEQVVVAAIEAGALDDAAGWASRIEGWRRAKALSEVARELARQGERAKARRVLDDAIAEDASRALTEATDPFAQGWQRDRVRAAIALAAAELGADDEAARFGANLADAELGPLAAARAANLAREALDGELARLDADIATRSFERASAALEGLLVLHGRFAEDAAARPAVERRIEDACRNVPAQSELAVRERLARAALGRGARAEALAWIESAQRAFDRTAWEAPLRIPAGARLAALRFSAGEEERALVELAAAARAFESERASIVDIDRADVLIPLAEAWLAARRVDEARATVLRAFDEASANPNSRPRADDFVAACLSIARHARAFGEERGRAVASASEGRLAMEAADQRALLARAKQARAALADPW